MLNPNSTIVSHESCHDTSRPWKSIFTEDNHLLPLIRFVKLTSLFKIKKPSKSE
jgi:hypothetical protein